MQRSPKNYSLHHTVLTALFAASGAAVGYTFLLIPNVEGITVTMFTAGYYLGWRAGLTATLIASILYFGFNPQGGFFPPLFIAQLIGLGISPLAGHMYFGLFRSLKYNRVLEIIVLSITGILITVIYDVLTNISFPIVSGMGTKGIISTLIMGLPFAYIHILNNALMFAIVAPLMLSLLDRYRTD